MKFTQRLSLRVRLTLIFLILASVTWLLSSFVAWKQTTDNVDELFDTQLMLFAKRLSTLDLNEINAADRMAQTPNRLKHGHVDDDALTFAIFTHDGRMVLNDGDNGEDIPYSYQREDFADGQLVGEDDPWRFVWMTSPDGKYRIVVGQEWEYREDMALAIVAGQLIPWLVALPIMLIIMMVLLGRELAPLNKLALALRMRDPDSEKPLNATGVPSEVRPLVESLNQLFARTHAMMVRERRFTSDAAHELLLVRNLLDNAVRYSPQGSVVDVTLNADNFIVRDNGPGVTPEALARIGERFYRPPGQTATGSGLGLSIVQRIAKLHGMNVEFGNAEQGGFEAKVSW